MDNGDSYGDKQGVEHRLYGCPEDRINPVFVELPDI